ncbi:MAG: hypothetical protein WD313_03725 [Acidimicrobiia bacterium]
MGITTESAEEHVGEILYHPSELFNQASTAQAGYLTSYLLT